MYICAFAISRYGKDYDNDVDGDDDGGDADDDDDFTHLFGFQVTLL